MNIINSVQAHRQGKGVPVVQSSLPGKLTVMKLTGISESCLVCLRNSCRSGMVKCLSALDADWFRVPLTFVNQTTIIHLVGEGGREGCGREGRKGRKRGVQERRKEREEGRGAGKKEGKGGREGCRREGRKGGREEGIIYESMLMFAVYISPRKMSLRCQVQWPSSQMSDRPIRQENE